MTTHSSSRELKGNRTPNSRILRGCPGTCTCGAKGGLTMITHSVCPQSPSRDRRSSSKGSKYRQRVFSAWTLHTPGDMNDYAYANQPPRGSPQHVPPLGSNSAATGATFFVDQKKGEINELRQVLIRRSIER